MNACACEGKTLSERENEWEERMGMREKRTKRENEELENYAIVKCVEVENIKLF